MAKIQDSPDNSRIPARVRGSAILLLVLFVLSAAIVTIYMIHLPRPGNSLSGSASNDYREALQACTSDTIKTLRLSLPDFQSYQQIWVLCGNEIYNLDFLEDFDIRREKLLRQELDERVILWMVVGITISGVILAGIQLLASYKLAATTHGSSLPESGQISIESGKLSIKSSVTGLLILAISLAFFVVYVKWVYMIQEVYMEKPSSLTNSMPSNKISANGSVGGPLSPPQTSDNWEKLTSSTSNPPPSKILGYGSLGAPPSPPKTPDSSSVPHEAVPVASPKTSGVQVTKQVKASKFANSSSLSGSQRDRKNCR